MDTAPSNLRRRGPPITSDTPVARRARAYRVRKRDGGAVFQIGLDGEGVAWLVRLGLLAENQRSDRRAVKDAFVRLASAGFHALKATQAAR